MQGHNVNKLYWARVPCVPQGPIPKFMEIGRLVPKKSFKAFYYIWARKPSGHVTSIKLTYFHFLVPKSLHTKFGQKRSSGF